MNEQTTVWLKTQDEKLNALLSDEAKNLDILRVLQETIRQLQAKSKFRLALLNQINEGN